MSEFSVFLADEEATLAAGVALAAALQQQSGDHHHWRIYLQGELGAGKTTLSRGVLQALGHSGKVKSPTFTLVEPYELPCGSAYHFDFYRLRDPAELEYMGVLDYFDRAFLCLVEWPEHAGKLLPGADLIIRLTLDGAGRNLSFITQNLAGESLLKAFSPPAK